MAFDASERNSRKFWQSGIIPSSVCVIGIRGEKGPSLLTLSDVNWEPSADWRKDAACTGIDSDVFFPASEDELASQKAKDICATCPVQEVCLQYSLSTNQAAGVWGGLDEGERRRLRRRLRDRESRKAS